MMRVLRDHILVRPDATAGHVTTSGIVIQSRTGITTSREQFGRTGTVVAVGPGKTNRKGRQEPPGLAVGEKILFGEFEYAEIEGQGPERLLVLSWQDVVGVVDAA